MDMTGTHAVNIRRMNLFQLTDGLFQQMDGETAMAALQMLEDFNDFVLLHDPKLPQ